MKFLDDSASFLLEKLKIHVILTKTLILDKNSRQYLKNPEKYKKIPNNPGFPKHRALSDCLV